MSEDLKNYAHMNTRVLLPGDRVTCLLVFIKEQANNNKKNQTSHKTNKTPDLYSVESEVQLRIRVFSHQIEDLGP